MMNLCIAFTTRLDKELIQEYLDVLKLKETVLIIPKSVFEYC